MSATLNASRFASILAVFFFVGCSGDESSADPDSGQDSSVSDTGRADTGESDADAPDVDEPDAGEPDADEPDAGEPDADEPDAGEPDADEPDAGEPDAGEPDAGEPDADDPDAGEPDADEPDAGEPDADEPDAGEPEPFTLVDRPANLPLGDEYSAVSHEAFRFGDETYFYCADSFVLDQETTLLSADFFGEVILGFYSDLPAFSVYILGNNASNEPDVNPGLADAFVHLEQIEPGSGVEVILEDDDDRYDVRVDFTLANGGAALTLPAGEYWLVAAAYGEDAGAGDPTLSWTWRFSDSTSPYAPLGVKDQFGEMPDWEPVDNVSSGATATAMAWTLTAVAAE